LGEAGKWNRVRAAACDTLAAASGSVHVRFYNFEIVIEKEAEDEGYNAYSPSLPGCFSNGRTIEETKRNMREAIQQHVEALLAHGEPVPQNERLVHVEELSIGLP
jgi:predicted RNase H-like HicB family nuclease